MARETAQTLKVLGHPDRLAILVELLRRGAASTSDLAEAIGLAQPDASAHLSKLTERGMIRREGRQRSPHELVQPVAVTAVLWGASELAHLRYNDADASLLAREMLNIQMTLRRGHRVA